MRGYAAKLNEKQAEGVSAPGSESGPGSGAVTPSFVQNGMEEMAKKFREGGDRIYVPVPGAE